MTGTWGSLRVILLAQSTFVQYDIQEVDNGYVAHPGAAPINAEEVDRVGVKVTVARWEAPRRL